MLRNRRGRCGTPSSSSVRDAVISRQRNSAAGLRSLNASIGRKKSFVAGVYIARARSREKFRPPGRFDGGCARGRLLSSGVCEPGDFATLRRSLGSPPNSPPQLYVCVQPTIYIYACMYNVQRVSADIHAGEFATRLSPRRLQYNNAPPPRAPRHFVREIKRGFG